MMLNCCVYRLLYNYGVLEKGYMLLSILDSRASNNLWCLVTLCKIDLRHGEIATLRLKFR